jgi:hypothetical protein
MPMTIEGDFLYAVEHDMDWSYSVVKNRIGGQRRKNAGSI